MELLTAYGTESDEDSREPKRIKFNPGEHQGRARSFSHAEGNFATHVFLEVKLPADARQLRSVLQEVLGKARDDLPFLQTGTDPLPPECQGIADLPAVYHVSLSRVVPVRHPDINPLVAALKDCLSKTTKFEINLAGLEAFTNDTKERSFLALSVDKGRTEVCKAISRVNKAFVQHGLQQFYSDAKPHASIAWLLGDEEKAIQDHILRVVEAHPHRGLAGREVVWSQQVTSIYCKIGRRVYQLWRDEEP